MAQQTHAVKVKPDCAADSRKASRKREDKIQWKKASSGDATLEFPQAAAHFYESARQVELKGNNGNVVEKTLKKNGPTTGSYQYVISGCKEDGDAELIINDEL